VIRLMISYKGGDGTVTMSSVARSSKGILVLAIDTSSIPVLAYLVQLHMRWYVRIVGL
jgi:hypothetical protein